MRPPSHRGAGRLALALLAPVLLLAGCPRALELRSVDVSGSSPAARSSWAEAEAARARGDLAGARQRLERLARDSAAEPLGRAAELELARLDRQAGQLARARQRLEALGTRTAAGSPEADRVAHERGLVAYGQGEAELALALLAPLVDRLPPDEAQTVSALLGESARKLGRTAVALHWFGRAQGARSDAERAYLQGRLQALAGSLTPEQARTVLSGGPPLSDEVRALVLARLPAGGRGDGPVASGRALRVGLLVPLGGRSRLVGERALRGAQLALQLSRESGGPAAELLVRDESDPARVAAAMGELGRAGVVAVVGPFGARPAQAAAQAAAASGIPLLTASTVERLAGLGQTTFRLVPSHASRARAIAEVVAAARARQVLIIAPASAFGRRIGAALQAALSARGLSLAGVISTPPGQSSFVAEARAVARRSFDALVIADSARQLSLWAPALARAGLWTARAAQAQGVSGIRPLVLVATADGADAALVKESGRYLQGAVLVPGFAADPDHAAQRAFVERYRRELGADPGLVDAVTFEAVSQLLRWAQPPAGLLGQLRGRAPGPPGLLGELSFQGGERSGPPLTVGVDGDRLRVR